MSEAKCSVGASIVAISVITRGNDVPTKPIAIPVIMPVINGSAIINAMIGML